MIQKSQTTLAIEMAVPHSRSEYSSSVPSSETRMLAGTENFLALPRKSSGHDCGAEQSPVSTTLSKDESEAEMYGVGGAEWRWYLSHLTQPTTGVWRKVEHVHLARYTLIVSFLICPTL